MTDSPHRVLSIEDEDTVRRSIVSYLEDSGYDMLEAADGEEGLRRIREDKPDVVLCDLRMPRMDGLEVLRSIADLREELPFIIVSGTGDMGTAIESLKLGAWDYITKPVQDMGVLEHAIERSLERVRLIRENTQYRAHLEATNSQLRASLRQLEEDETAARQIQFQLLPPTPGTRGGLHFDRYLRTSTYLSGDFVDYFTIDDQHVGFYIADVSGHGVSSALVTVLLKGTVDHVLDRYRRGEDDLILQPGTLLEHLSVTLLDQKLGKYLTMFYGVLDRTTRTLACSNGGHFPQPLLRSGESAEYIDLRNVPVGLFPDSTYKEAHIDLPEDFLLALFSDGVLEVMPEESVIDKVAALKEMTLEGTASSEDFVRRLGIRDEDQLPDDVTLLMVRPAD
jgi:serine phosphatase RsbU (regulator of sigma subunit)